MNVLNSHTENGASFDPFDGVEKDEATLVKIKWWSDHVEQELDSHRSPFVASEILLKQLKGYGVSEEIREELLLATVLPVLHRCASVLGMYGELLVKALHEILPAVMFTRTQTLNNGEVIQRRSYAECFARILQKYNYHIALASSLQHRASLEEEVMIRVVRKLDNLWKKMCFRAWRALCNLVNVRKKGFQRLAARGAALRVVPMIIKRWRRYAHEVTLREKLSKHGALAKELEDLYLLEQDTKSRHERILEEVREKNRLLETTRERCMETENKLKVLEDILRETDLSLHAHWKSWNETVTKIFCDTNESQPAVIGNLRMDVQSTTQNITDTATLYSKEAQRRKWKIDKDTICQYITKAKLGVMVDDRMGPDELISMVSSVCKPVEPPLRLVDAVRDDQQKYILTVRFLTCINDGGHCSLFSHHHLRSHDNFPVDSCKEHGKEMVGHVTAGIDSLHRCSETNGTYLNAIQNCLAAEELNQVHDYLGRVYCELAASGLPLKREKIESCVSAIVEPQDRQVVRALYPSQGIKSVSDMINYLTKVSQLNSWTITSLVEHIENHYDTDPKEELFSELCEVEVVKYFSEHESDVSSIFAKFKEKRSPTFLSKELMKIFLIRKFAFLSEEVESLFQLGTVPGKISKNEFKNFLLILAAFINPSPFVSNAQKLANLIEQCIEKA
ncbi:uncharacterized protein TM35_000173120 [Trypanosoma theileri]|uniref:Uncharacterized protein n=1 Tax=Trypanosoma theileri TaxID=67003 RepID=A0A1X0NWE9_9TRYP|nr:uncharacterized protein TM35_000173120 [Trypanosoma theileri]ORC88440.1 hypothetical protein TM35_000173120 [Trypanosoma theileri]